MELTGFVRAGGQRRRVSVPWDWNKGRMCLTVYQVAFLLGVSVSSVWRQVKTEAGFPRPRALSVHRAVWFSDELAAWIQSAQVEFGRGRAFNDAVLHAAQAPAYRADLLAYCVRTGILTRERVEQFLERLERV